jgi:pyruvate dehydrogenase E1 component beta subunit
MTDEKKDSRIPQHKAKEGQINIVQALKMALNDAMEDDPKVLTLGEDVADPEGGGISSISYGLSSRFGEDRVKTTPISEQAIMGAAIGASLVGYKPVAEIMLMNFTPVAMDMIFNHAAKLRFMSGGQLHVPIVVRTMTGAGFSTAGQHADFLEAWFCHAAGLKVVAPSNPMDAYGLMRSAIDDPDPVIFVENLPIYWTPNDAPTKGYRVPLGKARIAAEGTDVTIVTYSGMVLKSLAALEILKAEGVSAEIIDLRTVSPWDREAVFASVKKTGRCLTVHEAVKPFGVGAEIAATVSEEFFGRLKAPMVRVAAPFSPVPFSKPLETAFVPSPQKIADAAIHLVKGKH